MNSSRLAMFVTLCAITNALAAEPVVLKGHTKEVSTIAWALDGKNLATAGEDRTVRMWDSVSGRQTATVEEIAREGYGGPVVAFAADLKVVAINYWGEIAIRSLPEGKVLAKIDPILDRGKSSTFRPDVYAMALSPDGERLATAGSVAQQSLPRGIVILWDAKTGQIMRAFEPLATAAGAVAWSSEGKLVAAGTVGVGGELPAPGEVRVWEAETGKMLHNFKIKPKVDYGEWVSAADVAFSPDGKRIAAPATAGSRSAPAGLILEDTGASVRVWDLKTEESTLLVKELKTLVSRAVFSPDGKSLATAGKDKFLRLWDMETGKELAALRCPDAVTAVAFSPDGGTVAAGSKDGSVQIWPVTK